jgi:hypothetical protein
MTIDLHQNLNIETLQVMEFIPKKILKIQIIMIFQKYKNIFKNNVQFFMWLIDDVFIEPYFILSTFLGV